MIICGIDEAGRGPLAGPVTAAAVILPVDFPATILNDSKKLTTKRRQYLCCLILQKARTWATGWAWPEEIDRLNIHYASLLAMQRAFRSLDLKPDLVLVDGRFTPAIASTCRAVIKGDTLVPEIMAASIIAKVQRDLWMERYSRIEPAYRFEEHKGYPTAMHKKLIRTLGDSAIQRQSFKPSFP
jgi:ribonuclease HII